MDPMVCEYYLKLASAYKPLNDTGSLKNEF